MILLGPYLITSLFVQSGVFNDRSKDIRIESQSIVNKLNLADKKIEIITSGLTNELSTKKIIKISIFMPRLGNGLSSINDLSADQYAWATLIDKQNEDNKNYDIVYESKKLEPWKLIIKK